MRGDDAVAEPGAGALVEQDDEDRIDEEQGRAPHHQPAGLVEEGEIGDLPRHGHRVVQAEEQHRGHDQQVAEEQAVDRLAHDGRILADVDHQQHDQLAGEQHDRAGRDHEAAENGHVEHRGEIGLEEMHGAERGEEHADAEPVPQPEQGRHDDEIKGSLGEEQRRIAQFTHTRSRYY